MVRALQGPARLPLPMLLRQVLLPRAASLLILPALVLMGTLPGIHQAQAQTIGAAPAPPNEAAKQQAAKPPPGFWQKNTLLGDWDGARRGLENRGLKFGLLEQSEAWANLSGGLRRGATYDGLTTASLKVDLDKLLGIPDTIFFVEAFQIHGRGPSTNLLGNLQFVSSLEATRGTKLYNIWLETSLSSGRLNLRIGQEGAGDELMLSQFAALFVNSSFGFPALGATDLPSGGPNYPIATPFVRAKYDLGNGLTVAGAVFNGDPAPLGIGDPQVRDAGGTAFRFDGHALAIFEVSLSPPPAPERLPATYKIGAWFHSGRFNDPLHDASGLSLASPASTGVPRQHRFDGAVYGIVDQMLWRTAGTVDQGIGMFAQVMAAPDDRNLSNLFIEAGLNWKAPFPGRDNDMLGLAAAYEQISPSARRYSRDLAMLNPGSPIYAGSETCIELTYVYQATPWMTVQPDAQYVVNPGASISTPSAPRPLKNDLITGVRATVTF